LADKKKGISGFLQKRDWFLSAGLVMVLYITLQITLRFYMVDISRVRMLFHVLPLIAALMVVLGIFEKRRNEELDRERKKKRYQARMTLDRIRRESGEGAPAPNADAAKRKTNE